MLVLVGWILLHRLFNSFIISMFAPINKKMLVGFLFINNLNYIIMAEKKLALSIEEYKKTLSTDSLKAFEASTKEQQLIFLNAYNIGQSKQH